MKNRKGKNVAAELSKLKDLVCSSAVCQLPRIGQGTWKILPYKLQLIITSESPQTQDRPISDISSHRNLISVTGNKELIWGERSADLFCKKVCFKNGILSRFMELVQMLQVAACKHSERMKQMVNFFANISMNVLSEIGKSCSSDIMSDKIGITYYSFQLYSKKK